MKFKKIIALVILVSPCLLQARGITLNWLTRASQYFRPLFQQQQVQNPQYAEVLRKQYEQEAQYRLRYNEDPYMPVHDNPLSKIVTSVGSAAGKVIAAVVFLMAKGIGPRGDGPRAGIFRR